jgi:hypothetical protein
MGNRENQIFMDGWIYNPAISDINSCKFYDILQTCVCFFETHDGQHSDIIIQYKELRQSLQQKVPVSMIEWDLSQRKRINQLVKMGLIKPRMEGLYPETKDLINAEDINSRKIILSKAAFNNGNFASTMLERSSQWDGQLAFLIRTLEKCERLSIYEVVTLMHFDYPSNKVSYLVKDSLHKLYELHKPFIDEHMGRRWAAVQQICRFLSNLIHIRFEEEILFYDSQTSYEDLFNIINHN